MNFKRNLFVFVFYFSWFCDDTILFNLFAQLAVKGGPTLGVHVEYSIENDKIASIDRYSGRLLAISVGNTVSCGILLRLIIVPYFV